MKNNCCEKCYEKCLPQIDGTRYICTNANCECHTCKTNTLDKREKYRHDFIYHEVNGIIDQRLCRKCNLNEKLPEKNWNNEPCGNKLCENCHPEIYSKVKPEGVGEWKTDYMDKIPLRIMNEDNPQYVLGWNACRYLSEDFFSNLLLQEKAKWEHKIRTMFTTDEVQGMLKGEREVYLEAEKAKCKRRALEWVKDNEYCSKCCSPKKYCQKWGESASAIDTKDFLTLIDKL